MKSKNYIVRYENFNGSKGISDSCEKMTNSIWNDIEDFSLHIKTFQH